MRGSPNCIFLFVSFVLPLITLPASARKASLKPRDHFDSLSEYVGHMARAVCRGVAKKSFAAKYASYTGRMDLLSSCEGYSDRIQHMIQISGDDALLQLQTDEARSARRNSGASNYYKKAIEVAAEPGHKELLKRICRTNAEWLLKRGSRVTKEDISEEMQPQLGQWLLNIASGTDATMTNADLMDAPPEDVYPGEETFDDDDD